MIDDPVLVDDWHPVCRSAELAEGGLFSARLLQEALVLWRQQDQIMAWQDLCLHRAARLSRGRVGKPGAVCPYHGWVYNGAGRCSHIPAHPEQIPPAKAQVRTYQAQERYGLVWVCLGEPTSELHLRSDRTAIAYRRWLAQLGLTFGAA